MQRNACEWDTLFPFAIGTRCAYNLQFTGRNISIFIKGLIEVPHLVHQNSVGKLFLNLKILLAGRTYTDIGHGWLPLVTLFRLLRTRIAQTFKEDKSKSIL